MVSPSRALLFENGAALGVFHARDFGDGDRCRAGRSVVVMEPSGASFTHVRQDGGCHRQLSEFCRRDLVPHVAAVVRFRNAHSPRPFISQRLHTQQQESGNNRSSRRRRRAPSLLAQWPVAADTTCGYHASPSSCCTTRADGAVEVRAVGGNARLTLSASRTIAEVDYAVAVPTGSGGPADTGGKGRVVRSESAERGNPGSAKNDDRAGRAWVTRQFLVGSGPFDVPPEFSHALAVALRASSPPAAADAVGGRGDVEGAGVGAPVEGMEVGGRKGLVTSELPRPESRPEHPNWETVQASAPVLFDGDLQLPPLGYGNLARRTQTTALAAGGCLLSVDVMKLGEGLGFAGGLAAVVETTGGCTYRIVVGGSGAGGGRGSSINVHVVVHADGTEVWLEGDFVRLVRPPSPATGSLQDPPKRNREPVRERLLHTSAASTIRFRVPAPVPAPASPPPPSDQAAVTPATSSPAGWTSMSLGEITTRALALRRQFMALGTQAAGRDGGRSSPRPAQQLPEVKIRPSTLVEPGASAADATLSPPRVGLSTTVQGVKPSYASTRRLEALSPLSGTPTEAARARGPVASGATPNGATVVIESVDRGGASFAAFSDGRARGAFADRTIVTLGAPFCYLPLPQGVGPTGSATAACGAMPPLGCEEEKEDREIECIRPDGMVVRLTERSLDPARGRLGASAGGACGRPGGDVGGRRAFGPTAAASAASAAVMKAGRGGLSTAVAVGDSDLRPYIVSVLRFAAWAATPPEERQAAAEREAAGRLVAAAEAERNRRFVDLERVAKLATASPQDVTRKAGAPQMKVRSSSGTGGPTRGSGDECRFAGGDGAVAFGWRCGRRKAAGDSPPQGAENVGLGGDGMENLRREGSLFAERKRGVAGRGRGAPKGAVERNALVERLLEANREVLIRR
eukprot:g14307.t1